MDESDGGLGGLQRRGPAAECGEKVQDLLLAEERILQSISAHAPLPQILNEVCSALDRQIVGVVSVISLPEDGATCLAAIAVNAMQFGLYLFCSEAIVSGSGQHLGSLMVYASTPRRLADELQLIERAKCLAAIAINLHAEVNRPVEANASTEEHKSTHPVEYWAFLN